ncbi:peptidylprolyl isomerase [Psychrobium sp. 1_MG-2023]|uniref:peptidylprolyl isomerase n=1 Tax=Psychrobium sp. 1_MG-2023 TaxID=3062624 RepID=UPI000C324C0A|nr:peptidylprolyl isomerase [Psychrobium sp. 1_MG-2023]MDP2560031.1 peptidylprolyl isomerase [Psychrobium sp. 1_MG-2023]PKF56307.1 peptidylprolyl isomerase [Alteromonadales bacterium alter-6D02]
MKKYLLIALLLITGLLEAKEQQYNGADIQYGNSYPQVKLITSYGEITIELDRRRAPITANNFLWLAKNKEYDNTIFHRVINNFVIQGGGVTPDGKSKSDKNTIVNESGNGLTNDYGTIAMARESDPHSASRQFYINVKPEGNDNLNPNSSRWGYTVFGEVIAGMDVVTKIMTTPTGADSSNGWQDVPLTKILLIKAVIIPE